MQKIKVVIQSKEMEIIDSMLCPDSTSCGQVSLAVAVSNDGGLHLINGVDGSMPFISTSEVMFHA